MSETYTVHGTARWLWNQHASGYVSVIQCTMQHTDYKPEFCSERAVWIIINTLRTTPSTGTGSMYLTYLTVPASSRGHWHILYVLIPHKCGQQTAAINTFFLTPTLCFYPTKRGALDSHILILSSENKWIENVLCLVRFLPKNVLVAETILEMNHLSFDDTDSFFGEWAWRKFKVLVVYFGDSMP